jgi:SOS-response transcriptional repressor LexA
MSPIIGDGYIVIIDTSRRDPKKLIERMVAAREGDGVTIKWLRSDNGTFLLVPQHVTPRHQVRVMRADGDFSIVGEVVKWIGQPAPIRK